METGAEFWISGYEEDGADHLYGARVPIEIDGDARVEYSTVIRGQPWRAHERFAGKPLETTLEYAYPSGHPYAAFDVAPPDMDAATLRDALRFFGRHYHPGNTVLVIAGSVDAEAVRASMEARFGSVAGGPARTRAEPRIARGRDAVSVSRACCGIRTPPRPELSRLGHGGRRASTAARRRSTSRILDQWRHWCLARCSREVARFIAEGPTVAGVLMGAFGQLNQEAGRAERHFSRVECLAYPI